MCRNKPVGASRRTSHPLPLARWRGFAIPDTLVALLFYKSLIKGNNLVYHKSILLNYVAIMLQNYTIPRFFANFAPKIYDSL